MSRVKKISKDISREMLIDALRQELAKRAGDNSICSFAAQHGIFCGGFRRFTDDELRQRFAWLVRKRPDASRAELETLGEAWQLARQEVADVATSCDVQSREHDLCNGWDDFSDSELAAFYRQLTGRDVTVTPVARHSAA